MSMLTPRAKRLRTDSTDAERLLWSRLRAHRLLGWKFKRQQPIGRYIVDFVCFDAKLVIELDGGQHADAVDSRCEQRRMAETAKASESFDSGTTTC